jgi:ribosome-associated protein
LVALVKQATIRPKPRIKTKVSKAQKAKRVDNKTRRGDVKANRGRVRDHD